MTMMVTGHRQIVPEGWTGNPWPSIDNPSIITHHNLVYHEIYQHVRTYALHQVSMGVNPTFISGMALGADQLFASAVINLDQDNIPRVLIAAVPFAGQESKWPASSQEIYNYIISRCNQVEYVCEPGYAPWKMQTRNCWMVDRAQYVLAVWNGAKSGGTWNCLGYAASRNRIIDQLNPGRPEDHIKRING